MKAVKSKQFELVIALCALAANAFAASPICVSNTNDAGDGSLRAAITQANEAGGGGITFCITNNLTNTITVLSPLPSLTNITITGLGTNLLTISGNNQFRVFSMNSGTTNTLSGLTIANGMAQGSDLYRVYTSASGISNAGSLKLLNCVVRSCTNEWSYGAGIHNAGDMDMEASVVADCGAPPYSYGGANTHGGGIYNSGTLRMNNCRVSRCLADAGMPNGLGGGGILNAGNLTISASAIESCWADVEGDGGGILNEGTLVVCGCTVSNCDAFWGGGIESSGTLAMTNSTIVDNWAVQVGGGLTLGGTNVMVGCTIAGNGNYFGGGMCNGGELRMLNCTVSGNSAWTGGGIQNGCPLFGETNPTIYADHCTVAFNTNEGWGSLSVAEGIVNDGTFYAEDSIFAGNGTNDFSGVLISEGYNMIQNTNGCTIAGDQTGNIYGADPVLGPLQDNGGPTWTHALLPGSPCIDQGTSGGLTSDQRGVPRPYDAPSIPNPSGGDGSDIGAVEWTPPHNAFRITPNGSPTAGSSYALTITAVDQYQKTSTLVTGDHSFMFTGLAVADDGTYPAITDKDGNAVNLGTATTITFTNGVSSGGGSLLAYKAQTATLTGRDATSGKGTSDTGGTGASLTVANATPLGGAHFLLTTVGKPLVVSVSTLANLDYDPNHDTLTINAVGSTSGSGTSVALTGGGTTITYSPGTYVGADQFTYTLADPFGATATSTAKVTVRLGQATSTCTCISHPDNNGNVNLRGYGIPGHSYDVQRSTDMVTWTTISGADGVTAAATGTILYTDNPGSGTAYYRFAVHLSPVRA